MSKTTASKEKLWQGRYHKPSDKLLEEFSESISFDRKLYPYDIEGSRAHVRMLCDVKLISEADRDAILRGLSAILQELDSAADVVIPIVVIVELDRDVVRQIPGLEFPERDEVWLQLG